MIDVSDGMRLLFTHRYFWPDLAPYAAMLRSVAEEFAVTGHQVFVFASRPSYGGSVDAPAREKMGKINVRRTWVFQENRANRLIRIINVFLYCGGLFVHVLRTRPDIVTASTFPPVLAAWSASLAGRLTGARFIYHVQDIHPEVSKYAGDWFGRGWPSRLLTWLDNQTLKRASACVVLSDDMANTLRERGPIDLPIVVINNFLIENFDGSALPPERLRKRAGRKRIIFAGNLGRFQNLPLLAEGIARCFDSHPELELFFLGDGSALADLKSRWTGHPQVLFSDYLPFAQASTLIEEADIGLVSLNPGMYKVCYPSKVLTYLGLGVPVLAVVEPESMLARTIEQAGLGLVPRQTTPEAIAQVLEELLSKTGMRTGINTWCAQNASRRRVMTQWHGILDDL